MGVTTHRKDAWGESVCMIGLRSLRSGAAAMDACVRVVTSGGHVAAAALERSRRNLAHTQSREAHVDVYIDESKRDIDMRNLHRFVHMGEYESLQQRLCAVKVQLAQVHRAHDCTR
eukprot:TRINITY_DN1014_c0_g2_i4.p4 TRINITY_DN1014_c0_g2~~TRINITY_DN1014_c0_g2_i4.p4  ORF type:complete len:116 (+),score=8.58 TRINITY_DN1014_c0_g2_i4:1578-1925(+)